MHSLGYFMMIYQNKQIAYRQMSLFITSSTWSRSLIWWTYFYLHSRFIRTCCKNVLKRMKVDRLTALPGCYKHKVWCFCIYFNKRYFYYWLVKFIWKWFILFVVFVLRLTVGISVSRVGSGSTIIKHYEALLVNLKLGISAISEKH